MNTPLAPIWLKLTCWNLSPEVLMMTRSAFTPATRRKLSATFFACQSARALPRVPIRTGFKASPGPGETHRGGLQDSEVFCEARECRGGARRGQGAHVGGNRRTAR